MSGDIDLTPRVMTVASIVEGHDLLLSTLNSYLAAIGGRASVIVTFADGHEAILDLSQLAA